MTYPLSRLARCLAVRARAFAYNQAGTTIVEFAIVLPIFLLLLFATTLIYVFPKLVLWLPTLM